MESAEPLAVIKPVLPERSVLGVMTSIVPEPLFKKVAGWFGGEKNLGIFAAVAVTSVSAVKLIAYIKRSNRRKKWNAAGKDVVVLHTFRGKTIPSPSPFALKLETYLKLAGIKYEVDLDEPMGPKGKLPWITLNGENIGDSQLIIELLSKKFSKDLDSHLTTEQKSVGRALRIMVEDHFFWCWEIWLLFLSNIRLIDLLEMPATAQLIFNLMEPLFKRKIKKKVDTVGMGRHTNEEVEEMGKQDLAALSSCLGDKKFLLGDKPSEVDCAVFGILAPVMWIGPNSPYGKLMKGEYANLASYCNRMKETVWPDWEEHMQKLPSIS